MYLFFSWYCVLVLILSVILVWFNCLCFRVTNSVLCLIDVCMLYLGAVHSNCLCLLILFGLRIWICVSRFLCFWVCLFYIISLSFAVQLIPCITLYSALPQWLFFFRTCLCISSFGWILGLISFLINVRDIAFNRCSDGIIYWTLS